MELKRDKMGEWNIQGTQFGPTNLWPLLRIIFCFFTRRPANIYWSMFYSVLAIIFKLSVMIGNLNLISNWSWTLKAYYGLKINLKLIHRISWAFNCFFLIAYIWKDFCILHIRDMSIGSRYYPVIQVRWIISHTAHDQCVDFLVCVGLEHCMCLYWTKLINMS